MKKTLLVLFILASTFQSWGQEKLTELELDNKNSNKTDKIDGRINRDVVPAETNTYVIEYDFKKGVYNRNQLNLKINTPVVFKIININRLAYDVKVIPRDSILADTGWENGVMEFLKENSLPTTANAKEDEIKTKLSSDIKSAALETDDTKNEVKNKDITIKNLNNILYNLNLGIEQLENKVKENGLNKIKLEEEKNSLQQESIDLQSKISNLNQKIEKPTSETDLKINEELKLNIENKKKVVTDKIANNEKTSKDDSAKLEELKAQRTTIDTEYKQLVLEYTAYNKTFSKLKDVYFKILKVNECYNEIRLYMSNPLLSKQIDPEKFLNIKSTLPSLHTEYQEFLGTYMQLGHEFYVLNHNEKILELDFGGQSKFLEPAKNMKQLADNWNEEFKKADINALIHEMNRAIELLQNQEIYTYVSRPIQPVKDVVIFDVKIKKHNQDKPDHNDNREFSYKEYTKGGMRFDVGVGFALSYLDNAPQYEIAPDKDSNDVIALEEKNLWVPSFVGLFTANFRSNKLATLGISAGIGVSADNAKFEFSNFYFGPSLTLGRENRLCLTTGISVKGVNKLKDGLAEGTPVSNTNNISSFTNDTYKFGPFFSITYNLTKGIRNNVKYLKK